VLPKLVLLLKLSLLELLLKLGLRHDWAKELLVGALERDRALDLGLGFLRKGQGPKGIRNIGLGRCIKRARWRP
jgi:hypothetical protein